MGSPASPERGLLGDSARIRAHRARNSTRSGTFGALFYREGGAGGGRQTTRTMFPGRGSAGSTSSRRNTSSVPDLGQISQRASALELWPSLADPPRLTSAGLSLSCRARHASQLGHTCASVPPHGSFAQEWQMAARPSLRSSIHGLCCPRDRGTFGPPTYQFRDPALYASSGSVVVFLAANLSCRTLVSWRFHAGPHIRPPWILPCAPSCLNCARASAPRQLAIQVPAHPPASRRHRFQPSPNP